MKTNNLDFIKKRKLIEMIINYLTKNWGILNLLIIIIHWLKNNYKKINQFTSLISINNNKYYFSKREKEDI